MQDWSIVFTKTAAKEFKALPSFVRDRVRHLLQNVKQVPFKKLKSKKIRGVRNCYRMRIGAYRLVYQVEAAKVIILVIRIGHRKDVYRYFS